MHSPATWSCSENHVLVLVRLRKSYWHNSMKRRKKESKGGKKGLFSAAYTTSSSTWFSNDWKIVSKNREPSILLPDAPLSSLRKLMFGFPQMWPTVCQLRRGLIWRTLTISKVLICLIRLSIFCNDVVELMEPRELTVSVNSREDGHGLRNFSVSLCTKGFDMGRTEFLDSMKSREQQKTLTLVFLPRQFNQRAWPQCFLKTLAVMILFSFFLSFPTTAGGAPMGKTDSTVQSKTLLNVDVHPHPLNYFLPAHRRSAKRDFSIQKKELYATMESFATTTTKNCQHLPTPKTNPPFFLPSIPHKINNYTSSQNYAAFRLGFKKESVG